MLKGQLTCKVSQLIQVEHVAHRCTCRTRSLVTRMLRTAMALKRYRTIVGLPGP